MKDTLLKIWYALNKPLVFRPIEFKRKKPSEVMRMARLKSQGRK